MTTANLTTLVLPYARDALAGSKASIVAKIGVVGWAVLWPAWKLITGPLLPVLVRIAIELFIVLAGPQIAAALGPIGVIVAFVSDAFVPAITKEFLAELETLLKTPQSEMIEGVQTVAHDKKYNGGPLPWSGS